MVHIAKSNSEVYNNKSLLNHLYDGCANPYNLTHTVLIHSAVSFSQPTWCTNKNIPFSASFAKGLGCFTQGYKTIPGTNTIFFINKSKIPTNHKVTYGQIVMSYRPQKADPHCTQFTVGGNKLGYPWDASTTNTDVTTSKLLFNSTISTPGAKFITANKKKFYLGMPLDEYIHLPLFIIPTQILEQYKLCDLQQMAGCTMKFRKACST